MCVLCELRCKAVLALPVKRAKQRGENDGRVQKKRREGWTSRFVWEVMYGGVSPRPECWFTEPQLDSNPTDFHKPDWAEQAKALALA